ncbi:SEL1-like repeat protein [Marinobacter caseinilyticus]|uniref:SEL1-like repeat protein n=1 Tax=Marinobacter caseinilyticus TaxID=2692195 RepID=UPI00140A56E6|nr:sel1 repeat family protein [Marinobacter caseinilyticus]
MYQLFVTLAGIVLLAGCAIVRTPVMPEGELAPDIDNSAGSKALENADSDTAAGERLLAELFAQPYIDPLTVYLARQEGDANLRQRVAEERARRCEEVARRFSAEPATEEALSSYRTGYLYSCPDDVEAYARRLTAHNKQPVAGISKQLNDCYLLTAIRNYSEGLKACREPALQGDTQAQTNMALMTFALKDYANAFRWASEAAPHSGAASHLLGEMYASGRGVKRDSKAAEKWSSLAAERGYETASTLPDQN